VAEAGSGTTRVLDLAVIGAGAVGFLSSLFPWYRGTASVFGFSGSISVNAWNAGPSAWLAVVLLTAAAAVALMSVMNTRRPAAAWYALLPAGLTTLAGLCLVARWASWSGDNGGMGGMEGLQFSGSWLSGLVEASAGPEFGFYLALVAEVVALAASWMAAREALTSPS
jgi:hypothetical protein